MLFLNLILAQDYSTIDICSMIICYTDLEVIIDSFNQSYQVDKENQY